MRDLAVIGHTIMPDEILKNHFANHAFENFEIASYTSLIGQCRSRAGAPPDIERRGEDGHLAS
jgi:ferritin-like metal-binding protein YciE